MGLAAAASALVLAVGLLSAEAGTVSVSSPDRAEPRMTRASRPPGIRTRFFLNHGRGVFAPSGCTAGPAVGAHGAAPGTPLGAGAPIGDGACPGAKCSVQFWPSQ